MRRGNIWPTCPLIVSERTSAGFEFGDAERCVAVCRLSAGASTSGQAPVIESDGSLPPPGVSDAL